jgi:hypothetical protein
MNEQRRREVVRSICEASGLPCADLVPVRRSGAVVLSLAGAPANRERRLRGAMGQYLRDHPNATPGQVSVAVLSLHPDLAPDCTPGNLPFSLSLADEVGDLMDEVKRGGPTSGTKGSWATDPTLGDDDDPAPDPEQDMPAFIQWAERTLDLLERRRRQSEPHRVGLYHHDVVEKIPLL